jgi:hypothetical protein
MHSPLGEFCIQCSPVKKGEQTMARMASQAKKGFYVTPPHLIPVIASYLHVSPDPDTGEPVKFQILDPCAGEGGALRLLGESLGIPSDYLYGNELDVARFEKLRKEIPHAICGDANYEIRTHNGTFSVLYENPPYDFEGYSGAGSGESGHRKEMTFLKNHYRFLRTDGILIFVVPESILARDEVRSWLPLCFKDIRVFRFPEEDYKAFGQVVVFGRKNRRSLVSEKENYDFQIENPLVLGEDTSLQYDIPQSLLKKKIPFFSRNLTQIEAEEMCLSQMVCKAKKIGIASHNLSGLRPLMPLREGYQALLLATGAMDGVYTDPETGNLLLIRGKVVKKVTSVTEQTEDSETVKEKTVHVPLIRAVDLSATRDNQEIVMLEFE